MHKSFIVKSNVGSDTWSRSRAKWNRIHSNRRFGHRNRSRERVRANNGKLDNCLCNCFDRSCGSIFNNFLHVFRQCVSRWWLSMRSIRKQNIAGKTVMGVFTLRLHDSAVHSPVEVISEGKMFFWCSHLSVLNYTRCHSNAYVFIKHINNRFDFNS